MTSNHSANALSQDILVFLASKGVTRFAFVLGDPDSDCYAMDRGGGLWALGASEILHETIKADLSV